MEINGIYKHTSFRYHVTCYWAVNSAGKQKHCFSICAKRHATCCWIHLCIDIRLLPDLYPNKHLRTMHIYGQMREAPKKIGSHLHADFWRSIRIVLITPPGFHLKGKLLFPILHFNKIPNFFRQVFPGLVLNYLHRANRRHAKYAAHCLNSILKVKITFCFYKNPPLLTCYCKFPLQFFQAAPYLCTKRIFKFITVFPFYPDFCIF